MAKQKRYYYECVFPDKDGCEVGYWAPDQRRERWPRKGRLSQQPMRVLHTLRLKASDPDRLDRNGNPRPGDYLVSDKPIGRAYTEETIKNVSRPEIDLKTGVVYKTRVMRTKICRQKFRLLEDFEVDRSVIETAYDMDWREDLYNDGQKDVLLPKEAKQAAVESQIPEPTEGAPKRGRPAKVTA